MPPKNRLVFGGVFFVFFLLLTPLGVFNPWIPPHTQTGYYSVTQIDGGDDSGYYAYLRSAFFDGDLDFINEIPYVHAERLTPTGYTFNNWQIGQALLFLPFFLIGHALALLYGALGYPVAADGYSAPYYLSTAIASATWGFAGLLLVQRMLRTWAGPRAADIATLALWIGSPLLYFTFIRQRMAHTVEFFAAAAFLFAWLQLRKSENRWHPVMLGGLLGFLCSVRILNVVFFALVAADLFFNVVKDEREFLSERLRKAATHFALFSGGFLLLLLPQLVCWYQLNGMPLPPRHLHFAGEGLAGFSFAAFFANFAALFWGARWGLLFSMPLALIGLLGLFLGKKDLDGARPALLVYLGSLITVILLYPEDSASYGQRHLISALPVFALGLALFIERFSAPQVVWRSVLAGVVLLAGLQYFMIAQYKVTLPYNHPEFSLTALGNIPQLLWERSDLLLRSTNFVRLLFLPNPEGADYRDVLFMGVFPLLQFAFLFLAGWVFVRADPRKAPLENPKIRMALAGSCSLLLVGVILWTAPVKSERDIEIRKTYLDRIRQGDSLLKQGQVMHARTAYKEASRLMPDHWKPYFKIAVTYNMQGKLHMANTFYEQGLRLNPGHSIALTNFGSNLYFRHKLEEAEAKLLAALRAWPHNKNAYNVLAQVYVRQNRLEEAAKLLDAVLKFDPAFGAGHANLAVVYTMLNQHDKGKAHLEKARQQGVQGEGVQQLIDFYNKAGSTTAESAQAQPETASP